jgi:hypothetical protein
MRQLAGPTGVGFLRCLFLFLTVKHCCHRSAARLTLNGYQNAARGARIVGRQMVTCVRKAPAQVALSARDSCHVLGLRCITHGMSDSRMPIPKRELFREASAHLGLSANEEERTGASGSTGEGARLESAESLKRTFEGAARGGSTAIGSVSP